jgi:hypothetical protein
MLLQAKVKHICANAANDFNNLMQVLKRQNMALALMAIISYILSPYANSGGISRDECHRQSKRKNSKWH